ncbi:class I SAM-dependent methyltransferase [Chitinimonas arctica]|uniref:Class I SAM-dependent methyltransferase n=1 Tax=Chitinimonas arctica TaxID=2594795 RepID=A0A516SGG3_9NEIS|nr:methyltransferase domain-containing protein [Chitinimonas arctica]QDQ27257.1 class I SAM-dependent methyltransferase [Chitinimonas arctica]
MHISSLQKMQVFRDTYLKAYEGKKLRILDLGSTEIGACYKPIFNDPQWEYIGADLQAGPNVDLILQQPYNWREIENGSIDVFISGQVLEHVEYFWVTLLEMSRVLKPDGMACIVVPSSGPEHRYPVDCWRFYRDGAAAMARFVQMEILQASTQWQGSGDPADSSDEWHDTVLICRKPRLSPWRSFKRYFKQRLQHRAMLLGSTVAG